MRLRLIITELEQYNTLQQYLHNNSEFSMENFADASTTVLELSSPSSSSSQASITAAANATTVSTSIYPQIEVWGLDPLFHSTRLVLIGCLKQQKILHVVEKATHYEFYYLRRPINNVEVCGIVVNKKVFKNKGDLQQ
jgi:hypothetical protein